VGPIDPTVTFVHLLPDGGAEPIPLTPAFWRESTTDPALHRVVSAVDFDDPADLHENVLERHPAGDEVLLLASGELEVVVQDDAGRHRVVLRAGAAFVVPRGAWHRLVVRRPGRLIAINHRAGMETRPA
jgi:mannose-6-phosphate isomerase-like protein (cupin superfamily)